MKHIRSIVIGAAVIAAIAASSVSAQPAQGKWTYGCWVLRTLVADAGVCHALRLPMSWYWQVWP